MISRKTAGEKGLTNKHICIMLLCSYMKWMSFNKQPILGRYGTVTTPTNQQTFTQEMPTCRS